MGQVKEVTAQEFEQIISESSVPVLVDFWAPWCAPCRMIAPIVDELAAENGEKLQVLKVNIDNEQAIARKFSIRSIPTLLIFKNGQVEDTLVGAMSKQAMAGRVDQVLAA
ncbi:MAG: thioredoxin [Xanthomonadales bacterium]|jgi:thioredoxin 1|nr:thioredoxin [Xanthomonadales bacterium]